MTLRKASLLVAAFAFSSLVVAQRCSKLSARNTLVKVPTQPLPAPKRLTQQLLLDRP